MERKTRLWKSENDKFIEISPAQLEAEKISNYLTEEEMYRMMRKLMPKSIQTKEKE